MEAGRVRCWGSATKLRLAQSPPDSNPVTHLHRLSPSRPSLAFLPLRGGRGRNVFPERGGKGTSWSEERRPSWPARLPLVSFLQRQQKLRVPTQTGLSFTPVAFLRARCSWSSLNKGNGRKVNATVNSPPSPCLSPGLSESKGETTPPKNTRIVFFPAKPSHELQRKKFIKRASARFIPRSVIVPNKMPGEKVTFSVGLKKKKKKKTSSLKVIRLFISLLWAWHQRGNQNNTFNHVFLFFTLFLALWI